MTAFGSGGLYLEERELVVQLLASQASLLPPHSVAPRRVARYQRLTPTRLAAVGPPSTSSKALPRTPQIGCGSRPELLRVGPSTRVIPPRSAQFGAASIRPFSGSDSWVPRCGKDAGGAVGRGAAELVDLAAPAERVYDVACGTRRPRTRVSRRSRAISLSVGVVVGAGNQTLREQLAPADDANPHPTTGSPTMVAPRS